jgi:hypothetical protein
MLVIYDHYGNETYKGTTKYASLVAMIFNLFSILPPHGILSALIDYFWQRLHPESLHAY